MLVLINNKKNYFYKNGQKEHSHDKVLEKSEECTMKIFEAEKNHLLKMKNKLQNPNTTPNTYWTVLECFFYNKRISRMPPILADDKLNSDFYEKVNVSSNDYASACSSVKSESILSSFFYRTNDASQKQTHYMRTFQCQPTFYS